METIIGNLLSSDAAVSSPLTASRATISHAAIVVLGSDDGLCGAYNVNIFKSLLQTIADLRSEAGDSVQIDIIPVGRKMASAVSKICASDASDLCGSRRHRFKERWRRCENLAMALEQRFLNAELDKVLLQYVHYISAGKQRQTCDTYLPLSQDSLAATGEKKATGRPYLFEPDAHTIFGTVLPMYLLSVMQEAFAENRASEQAARVMAMQSANDNAQKLLEQLQLEYNKLRQQSITNELLDIVGGQARD